MVKDGDGNSYAVPVYRPRLRIKRLSLLNESSYQESQDSGWITELSNRSSTTYMCKRLEDLNIVFFALIDGYEVGTSLNTDIELKLEFLDRSKNSLSSQVAYRTWNVSDWRGRPTASHIGPQKVAAFLNIPQIDCPSSPIVYIMACRKFEANEIKEGPVFLHLTVIDHLGNAVETFDQPIEIRKE